VLLRLVVILVLFLWFFHSLLPRAGGWLGTRSRKPFRQAKWMWSWFAAGEDAAIEAERDYGRECAREFAAQFAGEASDAGQQLVDRLGARLAASLKDQRWQFRFRVVAAAEPNAFALPGGFIFITEPLLALGGTADDEIAFFLAHEMVHILLGHARARMATNLATNVVTAHLARAGPLLRELLAKGYSRMQEFEADQEGARLAAAAGFDPHAAARALQHLGDVRGDLRGPLQYLASHPPVAGRVQRLEAQWPG